MKHTSKNVKNVIIFRKHYQVLFLQLCWSLNSKTSGCYRSEEDVMPPAGASVVGQQGLHADQISVAMCTIWITPRMHTQQHSAIPPHILCISFTAFVFVFHAPLFFLPLVSLISVFFHHLSLCCNFTAFSFSSTSDNKKKIYILKLSNGLQQNAVIYSLLLFM